MAHDPAEALSLWRYHLIAEALSPKLSGEERGRIVRRLASEEHVGLDGEPCRISRNTLDRWIRAYRQRGLAGLRDRPRSDTGSSKRHPELIEEAMRLRQERPDRSAMAACSTSWPERSFSNGHQRPWTTSRLWSSTMRNRRARWLPGPARWWRPTSRTASG
jgi:transposase-like protein